MEQYTKYPLTNMKNLLAALIFCASFAFGQTRLIQAYQVVTDYTNAEEATFASTLTGQPAYCVVIYNTEVNKSRYWNGSAFADVPTIFANAIPAPTSTLCGHVPPTGTPSGKYLKDDITWSTIAGGGDLLSTNNLSDVANAGTARTNLGLAIGTNVQAYDADLTTYAGITPSANVQTLLGAANYAAFKTSLSLENITNESKSTMFSSPTFTGTVSGVTASHVGLGSVTNESKATMFTNSVFTGTFDVADGAIANADLANGAVANLSGTNTGDQAVTNSSDATSHTVTLSASGGSVQIIEGSNITLTTGGTAGAGTVTIAAAGGGAHTIEEEGTPLTARTGLNFIGSGITATDDAGGDETEITIDSDLNTIAGLTATTDNFITSVSSAWASRTPSQVKTTLSLDNVTNESKATMFSSPTFTGTVTLPSGTVLTSPTITTEITPTSDDGAALGSTSNKFSDLFLASGSVINYNSGDVTETHSSDALTIAGGELVVAAGTTTIAPIKMQSGTNLSTTEAGAVEFDGKAFYTTPVVGDRGVSPSVMHRVLLANATGSDVATAQPWFPTNGAVSVGASKAYRFEGSFSSVRSAGTTSHTTNILFGGSATITAIGYHVEVKEGDAATISDSDLIAIQTAASTNIKAASVSATENVVFQVWGTVWINAAGTFTPQFIYSAAPGGAPTIEIGTYFSLYPIGDNAVTTIGTWQ